MDRAKVLKRTQDERFTKQREEQKRVESENQAYINLSNKRALEFIDIMRANKVPVTSLYMVGAFPYDPQDKSQYDQVLIGVGWIIEQGYPRKGDDAPGKSGLILLEDGRSFLYNPDLPRTYKYKDLNNVHDDRVYVHSSHVLSENPDCAASFHPLAPYADRVSSGVMPTPRDGINLLGNALIRYGVVK